MILMLVGLAIFMAAHVFTTMRERRGDLLVSLGEVRYKALYSIVSLFGFVLIVKGYGDYRAGGMIPVWDPPRSLRHLVVLLMWPSFIFLVAAYAPAGKLKRMVKHPMLLAVKIWALAHLLANGDLGSMILLGAFLAYAVYDRIAVKKRGEDAAIVAYTPSTFGKGDLIALVGGTLAFGAMLKLHGWLIGVSVFG
jgi:uncharacterized membrane protein